MEIKNGDKFMAKKSVSFLDEGEIVKITNVNDGNVISFVFGENFENNGAMSIDWFNEYFEKIIERHEEDEDDCEIYDVTMEWVEEIMESSDIEARTVFGNCAIVSCRLPNGFVITETSSCANNERYDEEVNINICLDKISERIWELESYRLQWDRYASACDCDDCDDCPACECYEQECCDECEFNKNNDLNAFDKRFYKG